LRPRLPAPFFRQIEIREVQAYFPLRTLDAIRRVGHVAARFPTVEQIFLAYLRQDFPSFAYSVFAADDHEVAWSGSHVSNQEIMFADGMVRIENTAMLGVVLGSQRSFHDRALLREYLEPSCSELAAELLHEVLGILGERFPELASRFAVGMRPECVRLDTDEGIFDHD
jgi:hypothetical protein